MFITNTHIGLRKVKNSVSDINQMSVSSKDGVETNGWTDGRKLPIASAVDKNIMSRLANVKPQMSLTNLTVSVKQWNACNSKRSTVNIRFIVRITRTLTMSLYSTQCYSNTTVYYRIHERSECIPVDSGVTNLIHDRRSCVDFALEVEAARCVHSSVNKPGVKHNSGLWDVYPLQTLLWR